MDNTSAVIIIAAILAIFVSLIFTIAGSSSDEVRARDAQKEIYRNSVHYTQDSRTGLCFVFEVHSHHGLATVECTPKVLELVE